MKKFMMLFAVAMLFSGFIFTSQSIKIQPPEQFCVSKKDFRLYQMIGAYRESLGLQSIPLSTCLSQVAITHTLDLQLNHPDKKPCNLHSWSKSKLWEGCCYKGGKEGACMWSKPAELTSYKSEGYEIAAYYSDKMTPEKALELWKNSSGHNAVICNKGTWNNMKWKAMGVSIYGNYGVVWFGTETDHQGVPKICP